MDAENIEENSKVDRLIGNVIEYAEARFDIIAIDTQDKVTEIMASAAAIAVVGVFFILTLLLISIGAAMYISSYFESPFIGFLYVAAFYLLLGTLLYIKRRSWVKLPVINSLLKKINFHEED